MKDHNYFVYIMANQYNTTLYIGVTNDIKRRVAEHKKRETAGFTKRYNLTKLVYFEHFGCIHAAIAHEKKLKAGSRWKKVILIESKNPGWVDLVLRD